MNKVGAGRVLGLKGFNSRGDWCAAQRGLKCLTCKECPCTTTKAEEKSSKPKRCALCPQKGD